MQIHQLINHGCSALQHHGGQGRIAPLRLELAEVFGRHLPTLAGQLEQAVLVDVPAQDFGQVHQLKCLQPLDVLKHVPRVGFQRCLAQPGQPGDAAAGLELQQLVQLGPMRVRERFNQGAVDPPIGPRNGFRAGPVNHAQRRQDAPLLPQALQRLTGQQQALVGLLGQFGQLTHQGAEVGQAERGQLQVGAQLQGVLATGHVALAVLCPARRIGLDLLGHPQDDRLGQLAVSAQRVAGVAQQAELHGEAEAVGVAAPLTDQRQVGVVEGVVADQVILAFWQREQGALLRGREDQATRHVSVVRAEVLVEGFPADVELAGKLRLGLAGRRSLPQGSSLLIGQGFLAAPVRATLLGQGDALTLPLADQGALELSKGSHDRQHQIGHR